MFIETPSIRGSGRSPESAHANHSLLKRRRRWVILGAAVLMLSVVAVPLRGLQDDLEAYALLSRFANPHRTDFLITHETGPIREESITIKSAGKPIAARLYMPVGVKHPAAMVLLHGVHHLGFNEPHLIAFSRAIASTGVDVLTPELSSLADYHVDGRTIDTIAASVDELSSRTHQPVLLTGLSFAGGLSLLAATRPDLAPKLRAVVVLGSYDNLPRVVHFLITSTAELPDGRVIPYRAHEYGALVFVYSHLNRFFSERDLPAAHEALQHWLWEDPAPARAAAQRLSLAGRKLMAILFAHDFQKIQPQLLSAWQRDQAELIALSPDQVLQRLRVPVFVLHGKTDSIIPSTEAAWLARDIPACDLRQVLVTAAFSHVEMSRKERWRDELGLVRFVGSVLQAGRQPAGPNPACGPAV